MRILLIGGSGQLGSDYVAFANTLGLSVVPLSHDDIEITDPDSIRRTLDGIDFDVIVNTAAYHGYAAYSDKNADKFIAINVMGPARLAAYAEMRQIAIVHFSTDYVFSGNIEPANHSFAETDAPNPNNLYAISKYFGELIIPQYTKSYFIFRVASIYGRAGCRAKNNSNFVEMILAKLRRNEPIEVVDDIEMSPTSTVSIVEKSVQVMKTDRFGLYHLAGAGRCTWYDFAVRIAQESGYPADRIKRANVRDIKQEVHRGKNTSLLNSALVSNGFQDLKSWEENLREYLAQSREKSIQSSTNRHKKGESSK